jgi:putative two-component system response regulator
MGEPQPLPLITPQPMRRTVLVVDDDPVVRDYLSATLTQMGYWVETATGGAEALKMIARDRPDILLLDIHMPQPDGHKVTMELRAAAQTVDLPILMMTAMDARQERLRAVDEGVDDFITKPLDRAELVARIRALLRLKDLHDQFKRSESALLEVAQRADAVPYMREAINPGASTTDRVGRVAEGLARLLGQGADDQQFAYEAGIMHDVGQIAIPEGLLTKAGALTPEEFETMKKHTTLGAQLAQGMRSGEAIAPAIRSHHERWDGGGYPDGLAGPMIPLRARLIALADAFTALTSPRAYRPPFPVAEALQILEAGAGTQWDPHLVELFAASTLPAKNVRG